MTLEYDYAVCEVYYLRIRTSFGRASLGRIDESKFHISDEGRIVYREWISLRYRYPQIILDAFGLMPNFIHGILVVDTEKQRSLRLEHPRSKNVLYSFFDVVRGLQNATRSVRLASLQTGYSFSRIEDDLSLKRIRALIWQSASMWDEQCNDVTEAGWPTLEHVKQEPKGKLSTSTCED